MQIGVRGQSESVLQSIKSMISKVLCEESTIPDLGRAAEMSQIQNFAFTK